MEKIFKILIVPKLQSSKNFPNEDVILKQTLNTPFGLWYNYRDSQPAIYLEYLFNHIINR